MANPATAFLQAYNGKLSQTPGNNYANYNPLSGLQAAQNNPTVSPDPGAQASNEVQQSQNAYQSQQDVGRAQLQANLQASSVGGNLNGASGVNQSAPVQQQDPFAQFNDIIGSVNQRGVAATDAAQSAQQDSWTNKISGLTSSYKQNISQPATWSNDQVDSILGKLGIKANPPMGGAGGLGGPYGNQQIALPAGADPNSPGSRAVLLAERVAQNNVPYVWGGNSLTQGVDCSGLVQQVYGRLGIQLPRTSSEQAKYGKVVPSLNQALPGDLILMYSPYEPAGLQQYGHVGIYIGNGQIVEAPGTGKNVRVGPIYNMTKIVRPW